MGEKDDGNIGLKHDGFRAIGVGDCLYRLIMRWAAVQVSAKVLDIVKSRQFAIKVSGGAEIVKHTNQALFDGAKQDKSNDCFVQVDIKNAFGVAYRNIMYKIIREYAPELCGIFIAAYGNSSFLYKGNGQFVGECAAGTKQGDPLSSIFFYLVIHKAMENALIKLKERHPDRDIDIHEILFADDCTLFGDPDFILENFDIYIEEFGKLGLEIQPSKTVILLTNSDLDSDAKTKILLNAEKYNITSDQVRFDGMMVMGCPVGSDDYIKSMILEMQTLFNNSCDALEKLICPIDSTYPPIHSQIASVILSKCINTKLIYDTRTIEPRFLGVFSAAADNRVDDLFAKIIKSDNLDAAAKIFRGLGCKFGGLGCKRIHGHVSKSQHAKSLILTSSYLQKSSNQSLFLHFKAKYNSCIHPLNASLRFSAEQFLYDGEDVIDFSSLINSTTWNKDSWIKKYLHSFSDLFDITKIVDNDDKERVMSSAWDKAETELGKDSFDKMLGFRYHDDVGKVTESVSISAIFDKLLQKHVLLRAFQLSKDDDVRLKGIHIHSLLIKQPRSIMYWSGGNFNHVKNSEVYRHILTLRLGINNGNMEDGDDLVNCCGCHSKVTEPDGSEYFVPKQFKKKNIYLHYLSCHPIASSSRHWRHNYVRDMLLRFLKRQKFVVNKEVLFGHGISNLNPIPPNLTGDVDAIATQLDSQDTLYDSHVIGNSIHRLNSVDEAAISTQLDSQFSQMDNRVEIDGVPVVVPNGMASLSNSVEFTQSQQSVEGIGDARSEVEDFIDGEYADGLDDESEGLRSEPTGAPEVIVPTPIVVNGRAQGYFANHGNLGRIGMHRKKRNAFGHGVVQADGKISKGADCWYFDVTVGTSSLRNHLQNGALDDLDVMTLGLSMSKLRGQYNDRCLGGPLEDLDPLVILAFDHNGYLGSNSIKWIGDLTNAVLVDSFLQNLSYAFAYASGSIAYLAELMHLLGKSHGAVKNDIQNKINHLLRSGKRRRDTRDYDNIPPILGEDA